MTDHGPHTADPTGGNLEPGCPECGDDDPGEITADTQHAWTIQMMAAALKTLGKPSPLEDRPLSFDPDDYPVR